MKIPFLLLLISMGLIVKGQDLKKDTVKIRQVEVHGIQSSSLSGEVMNTHFVNRIDPVRISVLQYVTSLPDLVPGVFVVQRGMSGFGVGTAAGSLNIRGVGGGQRVLMLQDGFPQYMGIFGHSLNDMYATPMLGRVELIKGPASLIYGSGAMGGAINLISPQPEHKGFSGGAGVLLGSYATQQYHARMSMKGERAYVSFTGLVNQTAGHRASSGFNERSFELLTGARLNDHWKITAEGCAWRIYGEDPGPEDGEVGDTTHVKRIWSGVSIENSYGQTNGVSRVYYNWGEHYISDGFHSRDHLWGINSYQSVNLSANTKLTLGGEFRGFGGLSENLYANQGSGMVFGNHTQFESGVFLIGNQQIGARMNLSGGLRTEYNTGYGWTLVPQLGVQYDLLTELTLKAFAGKGYRSPNIRELYLFAPANPLLKPEYLYQYEISAAWHPDPSHFKLNVSLFQLWGRNLIMVTGVFPNVKNTNSGQFDHYGVELSGTWMPNSSWHFNGFYAYLHMDHPLPGAPKHHIAASAAYQIGKLTIETSVRQVSGLYLYNPGGVSSVSGAAAEHFTLLRMQCTLKPSKWFSLFIKGDNLLNQSYQMISGYPMPGITLMAGVNALL